jgi:ferredoxin
MRIVVDEATCEGNAVCMRVCPEVFEVRDDDKSHLLIENPPPELQAKVQQAIEGCPRQALSIKE